MKLKAKGDKKVMKATVEVDGEQVKLMAVGHVQKAPKGRSPAKSILLVSTASHSLNEEKSYFKQQILSNGTVQRVARKKTTTRVVQLYRDAAGVIDHSNHLRQG